jgi:hypothetical protein
MSLSKLREERKKLGAGVRRGPRTFTLVILLIVVLVAIFYLGRVG